MFKFGNAAVMTVAAGALLFAGAGVASADAGAQGVAYGSPGVLSGNVVQIPIHIPINACGNSLNIIGALNPSGGNACVNGGYDRGHQEYKGGHDDGKGGHDDGKGEDYGYSENHGE